MEFLFASPPKVDVLYGPPVFFEKVLNLEPLQHFGHSTSCGTAEQHFWCLQPTRMFNLSMSPFPLNKVAPAWSNLTGQITLRGQELQTMLPVPYTCKR